MHHLRFRQIHLDFHTSPAIPGIGEDFDKAHWQETLQQAHVDSITCFSKCHHGWSYHPTEVGQAHPDLKLDLLRAQMDACKELDINVPVYVSAGVDNVASHEHPEWREITQNGSYSGWTGAITKPGFHKMCFNTPYLDYLCEQIREAVRLFPECDGIFLDIISQNQCCCKWCLAIMEENGLDALKEEDRIACSKIALESYYRETTAASRCDDSNMPVFHNSGHIACGKRDILKYFSHLELESLPTGGWGYDHFPMSAKYCQKLDHDFLGMTGKFHTTWGEFGGFKHPNALRYECAAMIAYGSKCSVGDQLHPRGKLDDSTYAMIGAAYREVSAKEAWCDNVESIADIGLLSGASLNPGGGRDNAPDIGAGRILLEGQYLFDVLDTEMDFTAYKVIIVPDAGPITAELKTKLDAYLAQGGKLLLTGAAGLNADGTGFLFDIGAEHEGQSPFQPDYVRPVNELCPSCTTSPLVMYMASQRIRVTNGTSLGVVHDPYFNRDFRHFCSHQHAPQRPEPSGYDCGVQHGNIMYLAHPVFSIYRAFGAVAYKEYVLNMLDRLLGEDKSLTSNMPSMARISLMAQAAENRDILHLLYAPTINRGGPMKLSGGNLVRDGRSVEVIDDLLPLRDTTVTVAVHEPVSRVTLEPQGEELAFEKKGGRITLTVPEFTCHQMVVFQKDS